MIVMCLCNDYFHSLLLSSFQQMYMKHLQEIIEVEFPGLLEHSILASQAEQVRFLPYPRLRSSGINWLATIKITPRGRIVAGEEPPLQEEDAINEVEVPDQQLDENLLIDPNNHQYEDLPEDATDEAREDEFDCSDDDDCSDVDENSNDSE
ncbi:hypothetical protein Bca101_089339 [Brassica carinata]